MMSDLELLKDKAKKVYQKLRVLYPEAECELNFTNAFEVLIATVLSAQCTDIKVNTVTPELFKRFPTPDKMAVAN